ncbi:hypothetical protein RJ640_018915 [Escallonia rubra]|uniref:Clp R domain-containing protein n=1 Tax=Escallonia rubra TaxID=112253 RepID=A0AA88RC56_9ASTE|nr:hypothetical protein RJ640_018915 [Escallonia rubra]
MSNCLLNHKISSLYYFYLPKMIPDRMYGASITIISPDDVGLFLVLMFYLSVIGSLAYCNDFVLFRGSSTKAGSGVQNKLMTDVCAAMGGAVVIVYSKFLWDKKNRHELVSIRTPRGQKDYACYDGHMRHPARTRITNTCFTKRAWEGFVGAASISMVHYHRTMDCKHLMKALLEQENGLTVRIFAKAGHDRESVLEVVNEFLAKQQMVVADEKFLTLAPHLSYVLSVARSRSESCGHDLISV